MKERFKKKLIKRYRFASVRCGEEGLINIQGVTNHDGTFMRNHSSWLVNEWCGYCTKEEIKKSMRGKIR